MRDDGLDPFTLRVLVLTGIVASLSWLAKTLSGTDKVDWRRTIGGLLGSMIADISVGAALIEFYDVSVWVLLAIAGPVGWAGGDVMGRLVQRWVDKANGGDLHGR